MPRIAVLVVLTVLLHIVLLVAVPDDGSWAEGLYASRIYPVVGPAVALLPSLVPFSVTAVVICLLVIGGAASLLVCGLRFGRGRSAGTLALGRTLAVWLVLGGLIFHSAYLFWGYNYLRPPLEQRLNLDLSVLSRETHAATTRVILERAVDAITDVPEWDSAELNALVDQAMAKALLSLEGRLPPVVSPLKSDLGTGALAITGIGGVISPWTLEPHVDFNMPAFALPFTAAHEKAHQAGFARERDANFLAWYALAYSDDPRLVFAAYLRVSQYFSSPETADLKLQLRPYYLSRSLYHASRVSEPVARSHRVVHDGYLRANRMAAGTADYARVSDLIQAWLLQRE